MIKRILAALALASSALIAQAEIVNIDNEELARLSARGVPVIDVRTEGEWKESGVLSGSRLATFFDEAGRSNPPQWLEKIKAYAKPDQPVAVICRSGRRSQAVAQYLSEQAGYKTVYNVSKGMNGWLGEGRPVVPPSAAK